MQIRNLCKFEPAGQTAYCIGFLAMFCSANERQSGNNIFTKPMQLEERQLRSSHVIRAEEFDFEYVCSKKKEKISKNKRIFKPL